ncbi:MAG: hypothetical protein PHE56_10985 [Bacteroidales bacterium]|nr:hypothetical protein [Bacteroidales bacterium]
MNFNEFYSNISDAEKLRFLEKMLEKNSDLQKEFKDCVSIKPVEPVAEVQDAKLAFADIVANYSKRFEEDFSQENFSDVDWEEIYYPDSHYVEEWELVENHFADKVEQLYEPIKDLFIELLLNAKYNEILAAFCALYDVCQNLDIEEGDYCTEDCIRNSFSNCSFELVKFVTSKVETVTEANKNIDDALLQFFVHFFKEHENDPYFEKEIEQLVYALLIKSFDTKEFFKLFEIDNFKTFPKICSYLIEKNSSVDSWLKFALKSYQLDTAIAEKLLLHLHKTDTKKFISIALSLVKNPLGYKKEDFYRYEIDDVYHNDQAWNEFLCPLVNYEDHGTLFLIVNLNLANKTENLDYYLKVSKYLDDTQKEMFIKVVWREGFKIRIYIAENKIDQAKDIIIQNKSLSQLISLLAPFKNLEPAYCFSFITSFIDIKIQTERGRHVYSTMADTIKSVRSAIVATDDMYILRWPIF